MPESVQLPVLMRASGVARPSLISPLMRLLPVLLPARVSTMLPVALAPPLTAPPRVRVAALLVALLATVSQPSMTNGALIVWAVVTLVVVWSVPPLASVRALPPRVPSV